MVSDDRRKFLRLAASAGAAGVTLLPPGIRQALAIPAHRETGTLHDVKHIVVLMQENRSFDHYFAHLKGHGQDDLEAATEATTNPSGDGSGTPVAWHHMGDYCFEDTNHEWVGSHLERNGGKNDGFPKMNATAGDPSGGTGWVRCWWRVG